MVRYCTSQCSNQSWLGHFGAGRTLPRRVLLDTQSTPRAPPRSTARGFPVIARVSRLLARGAHVALRPLSAEQRTPQVDIVTGTCKEVELSSFHFKHKHVQAFGLQTAATGHSV